MLSYFNVQKNKYEEIEKSIPIKYSKRGFYEPLKDLEVKKNYMIAYIAQSIKYMAITYEQNDIQKSFKIITNCIETVDIYYPNLEDEDILRVLKIAKENQKYEETK